MKLSSYCLALVCCLAQVVSANSNPIIDHQSIFHPVVGRQGMVSSQEALASEVGLQMLQQGGNAVDAAVAVGFALAVTLPKAGNIGGGGFMLVHLAKENKTLAIDYREMAPARAHRDMFLDADGNVDKHLARNSFLSAGVPGTVAGLIHALDNYGSLPLKTVIAPAIKLADEGFDISHALAEELKSRRKQLSRSEAGKAIFYKANGDAYEAGERFVQKDLAWSLKQIARHGREAFYEGEIAKRFVADAKRHKGLIDAKDMKAYRIAQRKPVVGNYRGYKVVSMPPPSSGGVHVLQMLNILEGYDLAAMGHNSADYLHVLSEAMKYAYADRSEYLGDPDFTPVPVKQLLSKGYAERLLGHIDLAQARASDDIKPGRDLPFESHDTTHYSVVDDEGNLVSNTYTLNFSYGSGIVVAGTGILLNNEMNDFSAKPGTPNAFGLLGGKANAIHPLKRPLSSMTPTIVFKEDKPFLAVGSPGGSKIINTVLQVILNVIDHNMNIAEASSVPRIHHQWYPDVLNIERGISADTVKLLEAKGHKTQVSRVLGSTQSVLIDSGLMYGASDPRRPGAATVAF
ncbi:gamma-glutamyltransferase [Pseudomaricurvus alkylphenolicus]|uniref:gamma-glutamyltransferase n=1 Tax=Pseudomaricurvus alkylphenolicus TaxID=1306991 RepID=UPI00141F2FA4|nr:gamma-glutamyltransferase [Pseudomaricurvus alkylphenolicus]NIB39139.1 gamma-glutamyltransferase [Pseudomaricurvus alkylphenolicus]